MVDNNDKLSSKETLDTIRDIAQLGNVILTGHVKRRMRERDYSIDDIVLILSKGEIIEPPEYDKEYNNWKWKVQGHAIEGDQAAVIVVILSHRELLCLTIMFEWEK